MGGADLIPPFNPGPVPTASGGARVLLGEATLQQLPERLQNLPRGALLTGTIVGELPGGAVCVRTQMGDILLKTAAPLPTDKAVTLQIAAGQPPGRAILFASTPPSGLAVSTPDASPSVVVTNTAATAIPSAATSNLQPGSVVPALVLASTTPKPPPTAVGTPSPQPSSPGVAGGGSSPPQPGGAMAPSDGHPAPSQTAPAPLGADAHPTPGNPPVLTQGSTVALKIITVTLPGDEAAVMPGMSDEPAVLHGAVAGATPRGQPILATRQGMLVLTTLDALPLGAQVTATLSNPEEALHALTPADNAPLDAKDWPALRQIMAAIAATDPELAHTLANTILPRPNRKLGAALTFLLSAMRGGDARGWLGEEAVSVLERNGRSGLLKQLEEKFRDAQRQSAEPMPGDWRPFTVPLFEGQTPHPIDLYIHAFQGDEGNGGAEGERSGNRFLIDLELSHFGPLQLDGLVQSRRFDLILRTHAPLPAELRNELTGAFADSVSAVGYAGCLSFQTGERIWVKLARASQTGHGVTA